MKRPLIGQTYTHRGKLAIIVAVYRAGTMDVQMLDGRCYRVTGLGWN